MDKSTHKTEVVKVHLEPHPNADSLSIVRIWGYTVCVRTQDWQEGQLGAYIVPDSIVDSSIPEFSFLAGHERVRVKKLRGVMSQGLLVHAPIGSKEGVNVAEILNVKRYEPPEPLTTFGDNEKFPGWRPCYDVDSWRRYKHLFIEGEEIVCTEKVHGASARYTFVNDRMWCGSRTGWKKQDEKSIWWRALELCPSIRSFCEVCSFCSLYGEVFGQVQDLKYNHSSGVSFVAFDVLKDGEWLDFDVYEEKMKVFGIPYAPVIYRGPYSDKFVESIADGKSVVAQWFGKQEQIREGIVIRPIKERTDPEIGRVQLKIVSNDYLERAK